MNPPFDPALDLTITRIIKAPRAAVWHAWTDPASLEQWFVPKPAKLKVQQMDVRPGGAFTTLYSADGKEFGPFGNGCFLAVEPNGRLIFTDALQPGWRPAAEPFMTAIITLSDHPEGTDYTAHVMHKSGADRTRHEEMGFYDGWGTVAGQLADLVEKGA